MGARHDGCSSARAACSGACRSEVRHRAESGSAVRAACADPAPGRLQRTIYQDDWLALAEKLERGTVHPRKYEPGVRLCSLKLGDKFVLFLRDSYDPVTFITAGFDAGISQAWRTGTTASDRGARAMPSDSARPTRTRSRAYFSRISRTPRYSPRIPGITVRPLGAARNGCCMF